AGVAVARPAGWTRYRLTGRHPRDGLSEGRPAADERPAMAHLTLRSPWLLAAAAITPLAAGLVALPSTSVAATTAAGAPGTRSHFDLARKDCLGTARNSGSKDWFTVAGGVLSDTYYPTVDNTNVETLQYVVTDGSTFTDLQTRDMTYVATSLDRSGMACRVTSTARSGRYRIITDYVTDPARA